MQIIELKQMQQYYWTTIICPKKGETMHGRDGARERKQNLNVVYVLTL
jgi:hypothetical protein